MSNEIEKLEKTVEGEDSLVGLKISKEAIMELKKQYDMFRYLQQVVLEPGVDYGYPNPKSQEGKPSLYKSGAEKLTRLFNLTPRFEKIKEVEREDFVYYMFKCTLYKKDQIIGEGYGSCNSREKKHWNENPLANANTILKMAKKRAHVDAVLTGLGASNVFTQDLEDYEEETQETTSKPTDRITEKATDKMKKYINYLISQLADVTESSKETVLEELKAEYKFNSIDDLSMEKAHDIIENLKLKIQVAKKIAEGGE